MTAATLEAAKIPEDILITAASTVMEMKWFHKPTEEYEHAVDLVARALMARDERSQWQDIATAPHHRNVLVWREDAGEPWVAQYTDETFFDAEAGDSDRMDWFDLAGRYEGIEAPTHWMPLPAAPKGDEPQKFDAWWEHSA